MRWEGLTPDPWQEEALKSTSDRIAILASRQTGKSRVSGSKALRRALIHPKSLILIVAPSKEQSAEFLKTVRDTYAAVGGRSIVPMAFNRDEVFKFRLGNGSRIIALPNSEKTIRGYSGVSLLVLDEASRIPDDLYYTVCPMLATTNGHIMAMSTPFGKQGWFYKEWSGEQDEGGFKDERRENWDRYSVTADRCPRFSSQFIEKQRINNPLFEQEYMNVWFDPQGAVFREQDIAAATRRGTETWSLDWSAQ